MLLDRARQRGRFLLNKLSRQLRVGVSKLLVQVHSQGSGVDAKLVAQRMRVTPTAASRRAEPFRQLTRVGRRRPARIGQPYPSSSAPARSGGRRSKRSSHRRRADRESEVHGIRAQIVKRARQVGSGARRGLVTSALGVAALRSDCRTALRDGDSSSERDRVQPSPCCSSESAARCSEESLDAAAGRLHRLRRAENEGADLRSAEAERAR